MKTYSFKDALARHSEITQRPVSVKDLAERFQSVPSDSVRALLIKMGAELLGEFPENEVEVSHEYIATERGETPSAKLASVAAALLLENVQERNPFNGLPINGPAVKRNEARALLRGFLSSAITIKALTDLDSLDDLDGDGAPDGIYTKFAGHDFGGAQTKLNDLAKDETLSDMSTSDIAEAFAPNNLRYFEVIEIGPGEPESIEHTFEGYRGPVLDAQELVALHELIKGGPERIFRQGLLQAEIHFGQGDFGAAIGGYDALLEATPSGSPRRKFVALRSGFAHLGRGDSIYRKSRSANDDLSGAVKAYDAAVSVLASHQVSTDNPFAKEIVEYTNQQKAKIEGGFNYLNLTDGFVPIETVEFLNERARARLAIAKDAASDFEKYLARANALEDVEAELGLELKTADKSLEIANQRIQNATDQVADANVVLDDIAAKQDFLTVEAVQFGYSTFIRAAALIGTAGGGGGEGGAAAGNFVDGVSTRIINFLARASELSHQQERAKIQRRIAERNRAIAMLERDIVGLRRQFVEDQLRLTQGRDLNKDLYYRLANFFAQLTASNIEIAMRFVYLFERAVAFKFRKPGLIALPSFDFDNSTEGIIVGGRKLEDVLNTIADEARSATELDSFPLDISLRARYPIEFSLFQETGLMRFAISLYDLDIARPGTYDRRIIAVAVKPSGLIPPTGYSGTLTHPGTFLIRDLGSTLDPTTQRFIPTDQRLAEIFEQLQDGRVPGTAVDGVIPYQLDSDIKQLSQETETLAEIGNPQASTVGLFERYGAATIWTLELRDLDPRQITDIRFQLRLEHPKTEPDLRLRVEELIQAYRVELATSNALDTALDQITMISMRERFRDDFLRLETGESTFVLEDTQFPFGLTDLKLKAVIAQAINFDQNVAADVQLRISKVDTSFTLDRITGANGFTEDLDAEISVLAPAERFPLLGTWRIQLLDPQQFNQVFRNTQDGKEGDLRFFFIYEYQKL